MKPTILKSLIGLFLVGSWTAAVAQELRSSYFFETSSYRHQMNPALLDRKYSGGFIGNVNVGTTGNVGLSNFIYKLDGNPKYDLTTFMSPTVSADEFLGGLDSKNRVNVNLNYNVASISFKAFKGYNLVELNLRSNTSVCLPYELFDFMKTAGAKENYSISDLGFRSRTYMELALGHSHKIDDNWTVGAKVKFLFGLAYADFTVNKLDLTLNGDKWAVDGDAELKAAILSSNFDYSDDTDPATTDPSKGQKVKGLDDISSGTPGFGLALDLGATYKVEAVDGLTLSASLTDLGYISWSKTNTASSVGTWEFDGFDNPIYTTGTNTGSNKVGDQLEAIGDDLKKLFSVYDDGKKTESSALAATFTLGAEYKMPFYDQLSAGLLYSHRFDGIYSYSQTMLSVNCRPVKWFEVGLNTSTTTEGWCLGGMMSFYTKGFNFYIGSDRFIGKVSKEFIPLNSGNANLCLGICFPLS